MISHTLDSHTVLENGGRDGIRTHDPWLRRPVLYPTELPARMKKHYYTTFPANSSFKCCKSKAHLFLPHSCRCSFNPGHLAREAYTGMIISFFCALSVMMCR